MIDKIKNAKTKIGVFTVAANNNAGIPATDTINDANGADIDIVIKAAATSVVNKVLGVLDVIVNKVVNFEFAKIKEVFKAIRYSEIPGTNAPDVDTI